MEAAITGMGLGDMLRVAQPSGSAVSGGRFEETYDEWQAIPGAQADSIADAPSLNTNGLSVTDRPGNWLVSGRWLPHELGVQQPENGVASGASDDGADVLAPIDMDTSENVIIGVQRAKLASAWGPHGPGAMFLREQSQDVATAAPIRDLPVPSATLAQRLQPGSLDSLPQLNMPERSSVREHLGVVKADGGAINADASAELTKSGLPASELPRLAELARGQAVDGSASRAMSGVDVAAASAVAGRAIQQVASDVRGGQRASGVTAAAAGSVDSHLAELDTAGVSEAERVMADGIAPITRAARSVASVGGLEMTSAVSAGVESISRPVSPAVVNDPSTAEVTDPSAEVAELSIETPVDDANWAEALNYRLQWMAQRGVQTAQIQLNPAELGPMEVSVEVVDDVASVQIRADHGLTREALEHSAPRLRELMGQAGFERTQVDVSGGDAQEQQRQSASADERTPDRPQHAEADQRSEDGTGEIDTSSGLATSATPGATEQAGDRSVLNLYA